MVFKSANTQVRRYCNWAEEKWSRWSFTLLTNICDSTERYYFYGSLSQSQKSFWSWPPKGDATYCNCMVCYRQGKHTFQAKIWWICGFGFLRPLNSVESPGQFSLFHECLLYPATDGSEDWNCTSDAKPVRHERKTTLIQCHFFGGRVDSSFSQDLENPSQRRTAAATNMGHTDVQQAAIRAGQM